MKCPGGFVFRAVLCAKRWVEAPISHTKLSSARDGTGHGDLKLPVAAKQHFLLSKPHRNYTQLRNEVFILPVELKKQLHWKL